MKYTTAIAAALALHGADARMAIGSCPEIQWDSGFDHARFAGNWYEQKRDSWMTMDMGQMCSTAVYRSRADGTLDAQYRSLIPMSMSGKVMEYGQSPVMKMDCSNDFKCDFEIEGYNKEGEEDESKDLMFGFLATDYENWHVMYACGEFWNSGVMQTFWIYGKEEKIDDKYIEEAKAAIKAKIPSMSVNWTNMKDEGQGKIMMGLAKCEYEWDLDQYEKFQ